MNPKNLEIRINKEDGSLWACERKPAGLRRIRDITFDVMQCLTTEIANGEDERPAEREIKWQDGTVVRMTVELIRPEKPVAQPTE